MMIIHDLKRRYIYCVKASVNSLDSSKSLRQITKQIHNHTIPLNLALTKVITRSNSTHVNSDQLSNFYPCEPRPFDLIKSMLL